MTWIGAKRVIDSGEQAVALYVFDSGGNTWVPYSPVGAAGQTEVRNFVFDTNTLSWVPQGASSGAGGGDVNVTNASLAVTQAGAWSTGRTWALNSAGDSVNVGNFPALQPVSVASLPLPAGAATESTLASMSSKVPTLGQAAMAASQPVAIASNQSAIPVTQSGTWNVASISSLPALAAGAATIGNVNINGTVPVSGPVTDAQLRATAVPVSGPATDAQLRATALPVVTDASATGTRSTIASSATEVSLLAANAARKGFTLYNESTAILYLALGTAAASTTNYTLQVAPGAYYESPFKYNGAVRGVWASANGSARLTELT